MKKLLTVFLLTTAAHSFAQDWPVKNRVLAAKANNVSFTRISAFNFIASKTMAGRGTYQQLSVNTTLNRQLMEQRPDAITISIPLSNKQSITCDLIKFSLGNVKFTENNTNVIENIKLPVTYRGIVTGEKSINNVILTANDDYLSVVATMADKVVQVTKADEKDKTIYRLYNSSQLAFPEVPFDCGTKKSAKTQTLNGIQLNGVVADPLSYKDKCVNVFVDCFDSLYLWQDSNIQKTVNYVYELFNAVATGYYNDTINIQVAAVNVWSTPDPFRGDKRENALYDLAGYWKDNFFGNICVGLDYSPSQRIRSGIADDIGRIKAVSANTCPAYSHNGTDSVSACLYAELNYVGFSTQNFPTGPNTTGAQIYLVMHEIGHLLGAHHTQWCGWKLTSNPDTYGAIDSCAPTERVLKTDPPCPKGPPPPSNGGTIMSYCTAGVGGNFIGYYNGFGKLPGNAVRNFIDQSACLLLCVDCFGFISNTNNNDSYAYNKNAGPVIKNEKDEYIKNTPIKIDNPTGTYLSTLPKK